MKFLVPTIIFAFRLTIYNLSAQSAPLSEIKGYLQVYHPIDSTSIYIGKNVGYAVLTSFEMNNTYLGTEVGAVNTNGSNNTFFGAFAATSNISGSNNSFFGSFAGTNNINGVANTFIGSNAGELNTNGFENSFLGRYSGYANSTGSYNSFFGSDSGLANEIGNENTFVGYQSGYFNITGNKNAYFGIYSGRNNNSGEQNSFFGASSGQGVENGSRNTFVGANSGGIINGSGNVILGHNAGPTNDQSNRLYIDNIKTNSSLIYGEFDNDSLRINGALNVRDGIYGLVMGVSDVNLKEDFKSIDYQGVLSAISKIPIQEWQYIGSSERHIGPTAQDFYAAFGLGQGETTIATVDADGVALAAIKALAEENAALRSRIIELEKLEERIARLEQK